MTLILIRTVPGTLREKNPHKIWLLINSEPHFRMSVDSVERRQIRLFLHKFMPELWIQIINIWILYTVTIDWLLSPPHKAEKRNINTGTRRYLTAMLHMILPPNVNKVLLPFLCIFWRSFGAGGRSAGRFHPCRTVSQFPHCQRTPGFAENIYRIRIHTWTTPKPNVLVGVVDSIADPRYFGMDPDPHLWLTDPDSAIFVANLRDGN